MARELPPPMTAVKVSRRRARTLPLDRPDRDGDLMYYIILFIGVLLLLALVAWLQPARRHLAVAGQPGSGEQALPSASRSLIDRLLQGERKEDKPCITPIDCVQAKRCAGYCGCR